MLFVELLHLINKGRGGGGASVVVIKAVCLKRRRSRVCSPLWHSASFKETEKINIVGSLRDREVACSTSDRQT